MAEPSFDIRFDAADRLLRMRIVGFWSLLTLTAYTARLLLETSKLRGRAYDILSDAREFDVQSAMVSKGFEQIAARGAAMHRGRTAIVVASHLNRLQAQRTLETTRARVFLDMDEAEAWLRTNGDEPR